MKIVRTETATVIYMSNEEEKQLANDLIDFVGEKVNPVKTIEHLTVEINKPF